MKLQIIFSVSFFLIGIIAFTMAMTGSKAKENEMVGSLYFQQLEIQVEKSTGKMQVVLSFKNSQSKLIKYNMDKIDVMIDGLRSKEKYARTNGYAYANNSFQFFTTHIKELNLNKQITGQIDYDMAYHIFDSKVLHHSNKIIKFTWTPDATFGYANWSILSESES